MPNYPYLNNTGRIGPFFQHIQSAGVPQKVIVQYLSSIGFKSKNDRPLIGLAKSLGFLDNSSVPTARWSEYRDRGRSQAVMAQAIQEAYNDLFQRYSDAYKRDDDVLQNFFSAQTTLGRVAVDATIRTFKAVCGLADFDAAVEAAPAQLSREERRASAPPVLQKQPSMASTEPSLHVDIQIHIDSSASPEQIDQIFASMARHLYRREGQ